VSATLAPTDLGVAATTPSSLSVEHVRRIAATFDDPRAFAPGDALPALWHWAFFTPEAPTATLGTDGHPRLDADGPMADLPRRMWAGGSVRWERPLRADVPAERRTRVGTVAEKSGRSGRLLIVTLHHEYVQGDAVCIAETQDLVYREAPTPSGAVASTPPPAPDAQVAPVDGAFVVRHDVGEPLLLRYSAITFNAHRIHYDRPYATQVEGYAGLVVHGPLLATLLAAAAAAHAGPDALASITYRGVAPATAPGTLTIAIDGADDGGRALVGRAVRTDGTVAMQATFALHPESGAAGSEQHPPATGET
jgi:hydroxyacyl-ACP dehydratase HTD2-like protein with hotdog domain